MNKEDRSKIAELLLETVIVISSVAIGLGGIAFDVIILSLIGKTSHLILEITAITAVISMIITLIAYDGSSDTARTTRYYLIQPGLEELIFRLSTLIIVGSFLE